MGGKVLPSGDVLGGLRKLFPDQVFDETQPEYEALRASFWSGSQKALKPACIVQPRDAKELAQALKFCAQSTTPFAVKSGGHGNFAGQSSINGGVQLDLARLNDIIVDRERSSVRVSTGNNWAAVYQKLEKMGLVVVGGRAASVGVGGFILGGGISYYAGRYGWSIDNVRSFEVALVDGTVVTASRDSEPDLFRALRGGGSNFGIVASFELELYPYRGMWGGLRPIDVVHVPQAIDAFLGFVSKMKADPNGHTALALYCEKAGVLQASQLVAYTEPVSDPPIFDQIRAVPSSQEFVQLTDQSALAAILAEAQQGNGARHALCTITLKPDRHLLELTCSSFAKEAAKLSHIAAATLEIHLLPRHFKLKDDCYGLAGSEDPLVCVVIAFSTEEAIHDETVVRTQEEILSKLRDEAIRRHVDHPFLYMNYAGKFQDVIGSYGAENVDFLKSIAATYDPEQALQRLQPGPFKLYRKKE